LRWRSKTTISVINDWLVSKERRIAVLTPFTFAEVTAFQTGLETFAVFLQTVCFPTITSFRTCFLLFLNLPLAGRLWLACIGIPFSGTIDHDLSFLFITRSVRAANTIATNAIFSCSKTLTI
jgi:hypothetical protein